MDSAERWRAKKTSITQRNVDKELQRIKNLAVVSVLNKAFEDPPAETRPRAASQERRLSSFSQTEQSDFQSKCEHSLKDLEIAREQNDQQRELLRLQDTLIQHLTQQIEYLLQENMALSSSQPQQEIASIREALNDLDSRHNECETMMRSVNDALMQSDIQMDAVEQEARQLRLDYDSQSHSMDVKVETLTKQLKEKEEFVSRLCNQSEQNSMLSRSSTMSEDDNSKRSSRQRRSYIARWKGSSLPPASPPPSTPLPPIPSDRRRSSTRLPIIAQKHMSVDAVGGPHSFSSLSEQDVYYKEFTEQLQERLSMSKEMDDLSVWRPSDYDEIQRKIESEDWLEEQQKNAFWKGMKKKLKV